MQEFFWIFLGVILATGFILVAGRRKNYPKEKIVYAIGLIVAAVIYVGFGFFSGSNEWILIETTGVLVYALFAFLGLRCSGWFLSAGWALHVLWDVMLHGQQTDFVPFFYQMLCVGFDLLLAGYIHYREWRMK